MKKIQVALANNSYEIRIGSNLLGQIGRQMRERGLVGKAVIITSPTVKALYGEQLRSSLQDTGFDPETLEVPDGEEYKSLDEAGRLYTRLSEIQAERNTPVVALGGGVIGDLAGFVAATYMRGVPLVQAPTTLLAQVDSSIGGKAAVNHGRLKNNIGAFYQPVLVTADISTLKTLPEKEIVNGLAEVIKYGVIRDRQLFQMIEDNLDKIKSLEPGPLEEIIYRCAGIKAGIVEKDERDQGLRNILNFGHTVGHGIETASDFRIGHGNAVAVGMTAAGMIAERMGIFPRPDLERLKSVLAGAGLTVSIRGLSSETIAQAMKHDKKKIGGKIRFILPRSIGKVEINDEVSTDLVEWVLEELNEEAQDLRHHCKK